MVQRLTRAGGAARTSPSRRAAPRESPATRFDAAYYARFYESPATRVYGPRRVAMLARGVTGFIGWFGGRLESVLDVGAGTGLWRDWFTTHKKGVRYRSIEISPYACATYGHELRDITRWRARERFDLVICQGVLPYLPDDGVRAAIANIAAMANGFLYVEAVTDEDFRSAVDASATDVTMHARPARFYRELLGAHFVEVGCGLWYARRAPELPFYELERCGR